MKEIGEFLRKPSDAELWSVLDLLPFGVILAGRDRLVEGMNVQAAAICRDSDAIAVEGELRALFPPADAQLDAALQQEAPTIIRLARVEWQRPLEMCVVPLHDDRVAVILADTERDLEPSCQMLQGLYPLTPMEARVTIAIADGASVTEAAAKLVVA